MQFPSSVYPVTDRAISGLSHLEQLIRLMDGGARFIQIRDKKATPSELFEAAVGACRYASEHSAGIIINDRVDIALAAGADGVHLGQKDVPPAAARRVLGDDAIIGISTHNVEQALIARDLPVDYIAIGPVFRTTTKETLERPVGLSGVKSVRNVIGSMPLAAIGGITLENYRAVLDAGADSVALIRAVLSDSQEIAAVYRRFGE